MITDLSGLIADCRVELHRIGLTWQSERVQDYCEKVTGHRDAHYLNEVHLKILLVKLQSEPTPHKETAA